LTAIVPVPSGTATNAGFSRDAREFRPDIQGLRAIAIAMVVIFHLYSAALPGGFVGVDVFFVISGYLIIGHLWRGYTRTGRIDLVGFWGRRARRLIPAAALVLTATWIAARIVESAAQLSNQAHHILASALYFENWQLSAETVRYADSNSSAIWVGHFWSLSVEEQFYLIWPLFFLLAAWIAVAWGDRKGQGRGIRRASRARARNVVLGTLTAALVIASLAYSVSETSANPSAAYFVTTTRAWEFGIGGLLAIAPARLTRVLGRQGWLGWLGLAAIAASGLLLNLSMPFPGARALLPVLGAAALIAGGSAAGRHGPARLTSARLMVFTGEISYSLYLWHYPVIDLCTASLDKLPGHLRGLLIIAISVLLAWLTKTFVEDKVRFAPCIAQHRWRSLAMALAAIVPAALAASYLIWR
jgi:peptidoglycan/LPS O-acetylase OafA/YrhL